MIFRLTQKMINFTDRQLIKPVDVLLGDPHHGEGLARSCLPVSKASDFGSSEDVLHHWLKHSLENLFIVALLIEHLVKNKLVSFGELREINFLFSLQNVDGIIAYNLYNIFLLGLYLFGVHRSLSNYHLYLAIHYNFINYIFECYSPRSSD